VALLADCANNRRRFSQENPMKKTPQWIAAAVLCGASLAAHAQVSQVRVWAAACANCHGTEGRAEPGMASLAGKTDIAQQMLDFKSGRKPATLMHQIAKGYSDEQIQQIAAYFAALKK
jgi:cytochrome subunit of sulfide dehydrogenase